MSARPTATHATLLVSCPDQPGLVAALAQVLSAHGINILSADQHADAEVGQFFQRIVFDLAEASCDRATLEAAIGHCATRFEMRWRLNYGAHKKRVAILVSKYEHCLYDLLLRHRAGELDCEIPLLISNHEDLREVGEQFRIPYHCLPVSKANKREQEDAVMGLLREHEIDLVVLARYMQILSGEFISAYPSRIINIHHSFLPAFIGGRPYHQAAERGVKLIGATAHYATEDLDEGPIIEQDVIRASHADTVQDLMRKGRDVERNVLGRAVRWHLQDRVLVYGNRTIVFG